MTDQAQNAGFAEAEAFYRQYVERFNAADVEGLAGAIGLPCRFGGPDGGSVLETAEALRTFLTATLAGIAARGFVRTDVESADFVALAGDGALATISLRRIHRGEGDRKETESARGAYVMYRTLEAGWKIVAVLPLG